MSERYSDRLVRCDFCPSAQAYIYTIEMEMCDRVVACCQSCKKTAEKLEGFVKWLWPKQ